MRMTASWFRPPLAGIYRIQGRGCLIVAPLMSRLASDRLAFWLAAGKYTGTPHHSADPDALEPAAVLGSVKEWPPNQNAR